LANSPASQRYRLRDLVNEVQTKSEQLRQADMVLQQYISEINKHKEEIQLLQNQLDAEEQLRIQAEAKSSLMQNELERLHRVKSEHNNEREDLLQRIRQIKIELELIDASRSDSDESTKKVQRMVSEMQADHTQTKEEVTHLRETNKSLVKKIAHERQRKEQLLREITDLRAHVSELTPKMVSIVDDDNDYFVNGYDRNNVTGFSLPSAMHWRRQQMTIRFPREEESDDLDKEFGQEEVTSDEDDKSF